MKSFIFCILLITIICNSQGFVNSFNFWSYFNEDNPKEKMMIDIGQGKFHILIVKINCILIIALLLI